MTAKRKIVPKRQHSIILMAVVALFIILASLMLGQAAHAYTDARRQTAEVNEKIAEQRDEYNALIEASEADRGTYMEKLAREKYDYVYPGERIYQDTQSVN